ncbi:MAG: hypothetical protein JNL84_07845 [Candidatus Accumulibacter sp.]|nr:hypothetical protein [Accumulibacter sp.]
MGIELLAVSLKFLAVGQLKTICRGSINNVLQIFICNSSESACVKFAAQVSVDEFDQNPALQACTAWRSLFVASVEQRYRREACVHFSAFGPGLAWRLSGDTDPFGSFIAFRGAVGRYSTIGDSPGCDVRELADLTHLKVRHDRLDEQ